MMKGFLKTIKIYVRSFLMMARLVKQCLYAQHASLLSQFFNFTLSVLSNFKHKNTVIFHRALQSKSTYLQCSVV